METDRPDEQPGEITEPAGTGDEQGRFDGEPTTSRTLTSRVGSACRARSRPSAAVFSSACRRPLSSTFVTGPRSWVNNGHTQQCTTTGDRPVATVWRAAQSTARREPSEPS
jgi:hypothetical protein